MLAILPAYTNVFLLLLMVIYMYNVVGCIMFGGMFRFLDDGMYDPENHYNIQCSEIYVH